MLSVLTEKKIRDLKPKEKRYVVGDSDCLYLEIMPSGTKAWQFRQRLKNGETVEICIGREPGEPRHGWSATG